MEWNKQKLNQIRWLMVLAAALVLLVIYSGSIIQSISFAFGIFRPFVLGGVVAFVLNLPMRWVEETLLRRWQGRSAAKFKRPISMVLALVLLALAAALVFFIVVPQAAQAVRELGRSLSSFQEDVLPWLEQFAADHPMLRTQLEQLEALEIDWNSLLQTAGNFLKQGVGGVLTSTVDVATSIIGSVTSGIISFIFALYILSQKERLRSQFRRLITAYASERVSSRLFYVISLLYRNFCSFIAGQCLEAVILGGMFIVSMAILGMPYAVMIGVLIAVTALIPIVGAFIGFGVGAFMILIQDPMQAAIFMVLFLVLQQVEGNLIYPRVVGNSVGLPAIWVLMAVSVGGSLFGVAGMLTFIPLFSTGYTLLRENVNKREQERQPAPEPPEETPPEPAQS